jgi:selenoprotein W-related protein
MQDRFNAEVELMASGGGVFEVVVDGRLVYSKKVTGEFPDEEQLLAALQGSVASA